VRRAPLIPLLLLAASGCGRERPAATAVIPDSTATAAAYPTLPDSLALTAPDGVTVWFSGARVGTDSLGRTCMERGLVLVHGETRTLVPLLMTGVAPTLVNDSTMRARIWLHCRPGNTYDVDLRTGTPTRIR
jgi:hypothetical protein